MAAEPGKDPDPATPPADGGGQVVLSGDKSAVERAVGLVLDTAGELRSSATLEPAE